MKLVNVVTICLALALGCTASSDPIEPEFDGPGLNAKEDGFSNLETDYIDFGDEISGEFSSDFQFFAYEFVAREGAVIKADITQAGTSRGLDTSMFLYRLSDSAPPARIAVDDDSGWGPLSRIDEFRLYSADTYALVIGTRDAVGRGSFRMVLECLSGECGPVVPPVDPGDTACPDPIRDHVFDCLLEIGYENGFELDLADATNECLGAGELDVAYDNQCDFDAPAWCSDTLVADCDEYFVAEYPNAGDVAARLSEVPSTRLEALEDAAHESEGCGVSEDSGCEVHANAYRYSGDAPDLRQLMAMVRDNSVVGPGIMPEQTFDNGESFRGIASWYDVREQLEAAVEEFGADMDAGLFGSMSGDEFGWNYGDCQADAAVAVFPEENLILVLTSLGCYG